MNRRGLLHQAHEVAPNETTTITTNAAAAAAAAATTPTTSALLKESRQLLLKQQLKLQLNINVSEMMDNLRRNVDDCNFKQYDGDLKRNLNLNLARVQEQEEDKAAAAAKAAEGLAAESGQNKLDTVTTVPQLQQKFNKFNIIEAATTTSSATTTTTLATTSTLCVAGAAATTTSSSSSSAAYTSLTQKQPQNTALAKFNRIIDNTVPVINNYQQQQQQQPQQQQQHPAATFTNTSKQPQQQHPLQQPQNRHPLEMPMLSDSLKRRLASHHYTDLIVNNSKINFSSDRTGAEATAPTSVAAAAATTPSSSMISSPKRKEQEESKKAFAEDNQLKRNDVHYLLKQLNSFSDIEEIEIVDMKQKQRQQQQQLIRDKQQQHQQYAAAETSQKNQRTSEELTHFTGDSRHVHISQQHVARAPDHADVASVAQQVSELLTSDFALPSPQCVSDISQLVQPFVATLPQYISSYSQHLSGLGLSHHVSSDHICVATAQQFVKLPPEEADSSATQTQQQHIVDGNHSNASESKQHFQATASTPSPTATSLVIYSPSSQSHKGIRRYASLHQQDESQHHLHHYHHSHAHPHHRPDHPHHYHRHHPHMPHEHYSEGSILDSAAARAAACDPLALQQFVDDYIFQSCHYLETNNFAANYCTAMVESSSHEFRPSTTTTTRTSNEEYDDEECYVEDHSSAHSFELHECEPPTVICKAPAPAPASMAQVQAPQHIRASMRHLAPLSSTSKLTPPPQYTMETRLCSSGVQTDLTASSLAQSFSLSSSLSSSEQRKRRQPIFKCCYTPLDRWREKRQQQQQQQIQLRKRTKTTVTTSEQYTSSSSASCLKNTSVAVVGGGPAARCGSSGGGVALATASSAFTRDTIVAATTMTTTSVTTNADAAAVAAAATSIVVHSQHHSLPTKNAPYAV